MSQTEAVLIWSALVLWALAFAAWLYGIIYLKDRLQRFAFWAGVGGFGLETAAIIVRWLQVGHGPVMRSYENSLAGSWFLYAIYLVLSRAMPRAKNLSLGVLPIVLLMVGNGIMSGPQPEPLLPPYQSTWLWIHVGFAWLSYGAFLVAAAMAIVYLLKTRPNLRAFKAERLPPAEALDELTFKTILFGFVAHTIMTGCGAIWAHGLWGRYWSWDPIETWSLITWLVYALYLHLRITFGWRGRKAAWFAAIAAVAVTITFGGMGFVGGIHTRLL